MSSDKNFHLDIKLKLSKTISTSVLLRFIAILFQLSLVPISLNFLGFENYGLWVIATSVFNILAFADGGIGYAVMNAISHYPKKQSYRIREFIANGYAMLIIFSFVFLFLLFLLSNFVSWESILIKNGKSPNFNFNIYILMNISFFFLLNIISLSGKIQRGFQEGSFENLTLALGYFLSFILILLTIYLNGSIFIYTAALYLGTSISWALNFYYYFYILKPKLKPQIRFIKASIIFDFLKRGSLFFALQILFCVQMQSDNLLIGKLLGPEYVVDYSICMKLFITASTFLTIFLTPLWPAYREALGKNEFAWIRDTFRKSVIITMFYIVPVVIFLYFFANRIILVWLGRSLNLTNSLLFACAFWTILSTFGTTISVLINAFEKTKFLIFVAIFTQIFNIVFSVFLIKILGPIGAVLGSLAAYSIFTLLPSIYIVKNIICKELN